MILKVVAAVILERISMETLIILGKRKERRRTMWRLVNKGVSTRRDPAREQALIRRLGRAINASLKGDRRWRTYETGKEVKRLI